MNSEAIVDPERVNRLAVLTVGLALTMAVLDGSIANIALPSIARDFAIAPAESIWVVNAYQIAILVLVLPLGALGEILGFRRVYIVGLALFTLASLVCALSINLPMLALARVLQGVGAAGVYSVNAGLVRVIYPRRLLGRGIGINALIVALASALGPTTASALLSVRSWPILFAVNVPIGLVTLAIAPRALPASAKSKRDFDWLSALVSGAALSLFVIGVDGLNGRQPSAQVIGEFAAVVPLALALVRLQTNRPAPLLPLDLLAIPMFRLSIATSVLAFASASLVAIWLPFWLHLQLGYSVAAIGLVVTPWPLALATVAPLAGRLSDKYAPGRLGMAGLTLLALGCFALALTPHLSALPAIVIKLATCGVGFGLFQTPNNKAMLSSAPAHRGGAAGGMLATARLLGQSLGAALAALTLSAQGEASYAGPLLAGGLAAVAAGVSLSRPTL